jgi:hypothetical protein
MFWEHATIQQIVRMVTPSSLEREHSRRSSWRGSGDRVGLCPACRAFVRIAQADFELGLAECPGCRAFVGQLKSLWPDDPGLT